MIVKARVLGVAVGVALSCLLVVFATAATEADVEQGKDPATPPPSGSAARAHEAFEQQWRQLVGRQARRLGAAEEAQMARVREQLAIEADAEWAALKTHVAAVHRLRKARAAIRTAGWLAFRLAAQSEESDLNPAAAEFYPRLFPDVRADVEEIRALLDAHLQLARICADADAAEEQIGAAKGRFLAALDKLQGQIEEHQREMKKFLTPRQEAVLIVLGLLD